MIISFLDYDRERNLTTSALLIIWRTIRPLKCHSFSWSDCWDRTQTQMSKRMKTFKSLYSWIIENLEQAYESRLRIIIFGMVAFLKLET